MAILNQNETFLSVAYSVAVVSILMSFLLASSGNNGLNTVTGAMSTITGNCYLQGQLSCMKSNIIKNSVVLLVKNKMNEPLMIRSIRFGECNSVNVNKKLGINEKTVIGATPCFVERKYPVNIITQGVISGTTKFTRGTIK